MYAACIHTENLQVTTMKLIFNKAKLDKIHHLASNPIEEFQLILECWEGNRAITVDPAG